jgi:hypothetical protein
MRAAFMATLLFGLFLICVPPALASGSNVDQSNCHHSYDEAKTKAASISDATKKAQAYAHLKAAYADFMAAKYPECISEVNAVNALTQ